MNPAPSYGWLRQAHGWHSMAGTYHYVYLIRSVPLPHQTYVGFTDDLETRIKDHNRGASVHTAPFKPWKLVSAHAFTDREKAKAFEQYLKGGSGRAFARRHFW